jgi:ABC-2 type transport system permease protein/sodium transport system permease protein
MTTQPGTETDRRFSTPLPSFGRLLRLARKELTEILRDRRTIVTLIVMPLLLYPMLAIGLGQFAQGNKAANANSLIRIGFVSDSDQKEWQHRLSGQNNVTYFGAKPADEWVGEGTYDPTRELENAVQSGNLDLLFRPRSGNSWEVVYRDDFPASREALRLVEHVSLVGEVKYLDAELTARQIPHAPPVNLVPVKLPSEESGSSLKVFVPLVLILMTITGAVYPAIDLTAGERERGTLEVLVAAPIPRFSVLAAKYLTVLTVAVLTAVVNLAGMTAALMVTDFASKELGHGEQIVLILFEIFFLVLLFAAFFSAVLLVVTSFARSFKEAQAYLIPLMVVSLAPGLVALVPGVDLSPPLALVPLLNIVLLARDLLRGQAQFVTATLVVGSTAAYAVLAILLAGRVFGAEGVLYGESSGWRELFRRR